MFQITVRRKTGKVIIRDKKSGEFLLVRPPLFWKQKCYGFVGGGIKNGETPKAAVLREMREEIGLTPPNPDAVRQLPGEYLSFQNFLFFRIENRTTLFFATLDEKPEIRLNWELGGFRWTKPEEINKFLDAHYENLFQNSAKINGNVSEK